MKIEQFVIFLNKTLGKRFYYIIIIHFLLKKFTTQNVKQKRFTILRIQQNLSVYFSNKRLVLFINLYLYILTMNKKL